MSSFSSSSFDVVTTATTTNAALADDAEVPAKGSDGRDRGDIGLFHERRTEEVE